MQVAEPYVFNFVKDKEMTSPLFSPFSNPNNTKLTYANPGPNVEPTIILSSNPSNKLLVV
jgi:hypothetical protein